jgi:hypothetical protein
MHATSVVLCTHPYLHPLLQYMHNFEQRPKILVDAAETCELTITDHVPRSG